MEAIKKIQKSDYREGCYIDLECCICNTTTTLAGETSDALDEILEASGWKELDSEDYGVVGFYCGCDY